MLRAVHAAFQIAKTEENVYFAVNVNRFLHVFGRRRDYQELTEVAATAGGVVGSQAWFLSRSGQGEQLRQSGQTTAAAAVFQDILAGLEKTPSYNRCLTMHKLGRCHADQSQVAQAEQLYQQELIELAQLEQSEVVRGLTGTAQTDLADVLLDQGRYTEAKAAYQAGLEISEELGDKRGVAVSKGQLGTLALEQDELAEAAARYKEAIVLFQSIGEPSHEASYTHQLGCVYQKAEHWEAAEQAYRTAAQLFEEQGLLTGSNGACSSWGQLAKLCKDIGRQAEAEQWFRKALAVHRATDDWHGIAIILNNLAGLLAKNPSRLNEARRLAEEGLAIFETLDPAAVDIWTTYGLLAHIATRQGESSQAAAYRAKSRQAYFAYPAWRQQIRQHEPLIAGVVQASTDPSLRRKLEQALEKTAGGPKANLIAAIQRILSGQRDEAALCGPLDYEEAAVIRAILEGIAGKG